MLVKFSLKMDLTAPKSHASYPASQSGAPATLPEAHLEEEARIDNSANVLQESIARDQAVMTKKYNFDFANETALPGDWDWSARDGENWIGFKPNAENVEKDKACNMKLENETTPREKTDKELPAVRKRKSDAAASDTGARRKISFD